MHAIVPYIKVASTNYNSKVHSKSGYNSLKELA